jgi:hypothetical protein
VINQQRCGPRTCGKRTLGIKYFWFLESRERISGTVAEPDAGELLTSAYQATMVCTVVRSASSKSEPLSGCLRLEFSRIKTWAWEADMGVLEK